MVGFASRHLQGDIAYCIASTCSRRAHNGGQKLERKVIAKDVSYLVSVG